MKIVHRFALVVAASLVAGCPAGERKDVPAERSATPLRPRTAEPATIFDVDVAVPADFEEEAARDIDRDSYKAALDAVEAEMAR